MMDQKQTPTALPQAPASTETPSAHQDVTGPTSDDDLHDALEDTFPGSDPINFAGSTAGRSAENAENDPVEARSLSGTDRVDSARQDEIDAAADVGGDARNDR